MPKKKKQESPKEESVEMENKINFPDYTEDELEYRQMVIKRMVHAKNERDKPRREFNDMDYRNYYDSNLRAANSYIPPKKNPEDTRVVTGTTEEKSVTLISAILNYNLEPNIIAFDNNDMEVDELGRTMEDLIKKSREIEDYDVKRMLIIKELLDQGTCFVEEQWVDERKVEKKLKNIDWYNGIQVANIDWTEKEVRGFQGAQVRLIAGDKVYLGNPNEFEIKKQPYIATIDIMSYEEAKAIYGNWDRFEFVPKKIVRSEPLDNSSYRDWTLEQQQENFVEVIKYQDRFNNEFMIMLNGVMMLPIRFPLSVVSPSGEYSIAKGDLYPNGQFCAYSKSVPAKTKVDQEVLDEMMKLIILKTRKSYKPPLANNTGKVLSRKIFNPGNIENQINPDQIKEIGNNNGVTPAEFNAFEFIKRIVDEKSVSPGFMGDQTRGKQTATEILELKKQQMMKLGLAIYGVISLERQLSWLRIYNILENWTKVQDKKMNDITGKMENIFKSITVDTQLEDTQQGTKIIQFSEDAGEYSPDQIMEEENQLSDAMRKPVRKVYLNPDICKMKYYWFITISPTEKDTSDLQRILFKQDIADAMQLFGPQTLNFPYLMKRFAALSKQDPEKFFVKNVPAQPTEAQLAGGDNGGLGAQLNRGAGTAPLGG